MEYLQTTANSKAAILIISDRWGSPFQGGIPAAVRLLAQLFNSLGFVVYCTVLKATEEEDKDAKKLNVTLVLPKLRGSLDWSEKNKPCRKWLLSHESYFGNLKNLAKEANIKIVLGFALATSEASCNIKDNVFVTAKYYITNLWPCDKLPPSILGCSKKILIKLINMLQETHHKEADAVTSIDHKTFQSFINTLKTDMHFQILPTPEKKYFSSNPPSQSLEISEKQMFSCLEEHDELEISTHINLTKAINSAARNYHTVLQEQLKWVIHGVQSTTEEDIINTLKPFRHLEIVPRPRFSSCLIENDLRCSHLVLIPPKSPGINSLHLLISTLATGIPLLVAMYSPSHDFIKTYFKDYVDDMVVDMATPEALSEKILHIFTNYQCFLKKAAAIKEKFKKKTVALIDDLNHRFIDHVTTDCDLARFLPPAHNGNWGSSKDLQGDEAAKVPDENPQKNVQNLGQETEDQNAGHDTSGQMTVCVTPIVIPEENQPVAHVADRYRRLPEVVGETPRQINSIYTGITVEGITKGSIIYHVKCTTLDAVEELWRYYTSQKLHKLITSTTITKKTLAKIRAVYLELQVTMDIQEYRQCKRELAQKVKRAKVLFKYTPMNPDELGLNKGDIVTVLSQDAGDHGLWKGELKGKVGVFPYSFVKLIEDEPETHQVHNRDKPKKPPPSPPKPEKAPVKRAKVLFKYTRMNPGELGLNKGDIVTVLSQDAGDHGLWKGELKGKVGVFPYSFVKLIEDEPETHQVHNRDKPKKPPPPPPKSKIAPVKRAKVLFKYTPMNPDELGLNKGDIVTVLSQDAGDHGLWKGELRGKVGVFPYSFVKLIEDEPETHQVHNRDKPKKPPPPPPKPKKAPGQPLEVDSQSEGQTTETFHARTVNMRERNEPTEKLESLEGIERGDHLVVKRGTHEHHVLVLEDIEVPTKTSVNVIEYYDDGFIRGSKRVLKRKISVDFEKDLFYRIDSDFIMLSNAIERVIKKAETQIGFATYCHTIENSCEHFVHWCFEDTIYWEKIVKISDIKRGDHIIYDRYNDKHMLAIRDGSQFRQLQVVLYTSGKVAVAWISFSVEDDMIYRVVYPNYCSSDGILNDVNNVLRKAKSQIGFKKYSSEANNNEHFVKWCMTETGHRERLNNMADIKRGDHLIYEGFLGEYHYLALENGKIRCDKIREIHYQSGEVVEREEKLGTTAGKLYRFVDDDQELVQHDVEEIISQAERQLYRSTYCDYANDNEHFVYWCRTRAEHKSRIRRLGELKKGDHIIMERYKNLNEIHALVVKNEHGKLEIIYYGHNKVNRALLCADSLKTDIFRFNEDAYSGISSPLAKDSIIEKAEREVGKCFYSAQANNNIHFVQWCKVHTETIEEVEKIQEIESGDLFIIQTKANNYNEMYKATKKGQQNTIYAVTVALGVIPTDQNEAVSVTFDAEKQRLFRVLGSFEGNTGSPFNRAFIKLVQIISSEALNQRQVFRGEQIKKGDHVMFRARSDSRFHHYLAVEDGKPDNSVNVIYYCPSTRKSWRNVNEEVINIKSDDVIYYKFSYDDAYDPEKAVRRAREMLAHYMPFNCLYFVLLSKLPFTAQEVGLSTLDKNIRGISSTTSDDLAADSAILRILFSATLKGVGRASATDSIAAASAAGAAVVTEGIVSTIEAIMKQGKINQVRNSIPHEKPIGLLIGAIASTLKSAISAGVVGQILIPVPVVGFAVGAAVGGVVGIVSSLGIAGLIALSKKGGDLYKVFLQRRRAGGRVNM